MYAKVPKKKLFVTKKYGRFILYVAKHTHTELASKVAKANDTYIEKISHKGHT